MLPSEMIQQLKRNNISADAEKTQTRVSEIWRTASKSQKEECTSLSGMVNQTVYRVFRTGGISARLALSIAQSMDVDPSYLTGQTDNKGSYSEESSREFLKSLGDEALLVVYDKEIRKQRRAAKKAAEIQEPVTVEESSAIAKGPTSAEASPYDLEKMSEDDMVVIMQSILAKAKLGGPYAETANKLKRFLLEEK